MKPRIRVPIPLEPAEECDPALQVGSRRFFHVYYIQILTTHINLQQKFAHWIHLKRTQNLHFNTRLQQTHAFHNPSSMQKLIEFLGLNEHASFYDPNVFDPFGFPEEAFADKIEEEQKRLLSQPGSVVTAAAVGSSANAGIQFVSAGTPDTTSTTTSMSQPIPKKELPPAASEALKRWKEKWDKR